MKHQISLHFNNLQIFNNEKTNHKTIQLEEVSPVIRSVNPFIEKDSTLVVEGI